MLVKSDKGFIKNESILHCLLFKPMSKIFNYRLMFLLLSKIMFIMTLALCLCIPIGFFYNDDVKPFIYSFLLTLISGIIFHFLSIRKINIFSIQKKEAYLSVFVSWIFVSIIGCLPYIFSHAIPNITNAFFESISGFTTTGASILTDIESLPKTILFWRSLTHWIGGIGIIVLVIVIMPSFQIGSYQLFTMESSLQEKIQPKIKSVGKRLLLIYLALTFLEILLLLAGGMNLFESTCHAFGTVATGGFSPKNSSIGGYSPYIQYVIMIFMFLAGTNFVIHYYLFKRDFSKLKRNEEFTFYLKVVIIIGLIVSTILYFKMGKNPEEAFREGFFQVISIITCTGYATADYMQWPVIAWSIMFFIMFLGGSTGSTAGGIKMSRHLIILKNIKRYTRQAVSTYSVVPIKFNGNTLNEGTNRSILSFIGLYIIVFIIGSLVLVIIGLDGLTACSSAATCMAGIGPGIGSVGPVGNFFHLPLAAKWVLSFLMLAGRLEIYTVLILFTPGFWRN
jgi:trk system potassium uptake protein